MILYRYMSVLNPHFWLSSVLEVQSSRMQFWATFIFWLFVRHSSLPQTISISTASTMNPHMSKSWSWRCWQLLQMRATLTKLVFFKTVGTKTLLFWLFNMAFFLFCPFSYRTVRICCKRWYCNCKGINSGSWEDCFAAVWRKCHCW